jgi:hypothetical protein
VGSETLHGHVTLLGAATKHYMGLSHCLVRQHAMSNQQHTHRTVFPHHGSKANMTTEKGISSSVFDPKSATLVVSEHVYV